MTTSGDGPPPFDPGAPPSSVDPAPTRTPPASDSAEHETVVIAPTGRPRHAIEGETPRRTAPTPLGRVLLPLGLALVSAVALVAAWAHLQDDRAASSSAPTPGSSQVHVSSAPSTTSTTSASVSPTPSVTPSVTTSPSAVASSPAASPSASVASKVDRSVPVVVLNSTSRTGLAAKVAAQLRKDGWAVVQVGNFRGTLAVTTVYAEGHADAVATMQADLPTRDRQKAPLGAMNPNRLTVVIGTDYPRG